MTEKTLTTENIKPALDALRGELAPWPVVAMKQDRLNDTQKSAVNSGITSGLVAQIIANTAAIRALESAITGTGLRPLVVASLPAIGTQGILYIVPVTTYDPDTDADVVNYSNEYIWIPVEAGTASEGHYEQVGQTGIVINNGQLTITVNGTSVGTFTANQSGDTTAAITVPTNADYVDRTTAQTVAGVKTFSDGIVGNVTGTASKAIADEDGTSIKSGYVNVAGSQTVTGDKSFTGSNTFNNILPNATNTYSLGSSSYQWSSVYAQSYYYNGTQWGLDQANIWNANQTILKDSEALCVLKRSNLKLGDAIPQTTQVLGTFAFTGSDGANAGIVTFRDNSNGDTSLIILARQRYNSNGARDPAGIQYETRLDIGIDSSRNHYIRPNSNGDINLGTSTNQWKSIYAQTYYYNGTAWGLDKANVWSNLNTFQKGIFLVGDRQAYVCPMWSGSSSGLSLLTNSKAVFVGTYTDDASGRKVIDTTKGYIQFHTGTSGTDNIAIIEPTNTTNSQLGNSTNKWKTLNGVNPGALSLPSSSYVDIDTTNWDLTGATSQSYTPAVPGWLFVSIQNIAGNYLSIVGGRGAVSMDGTGAQAGLSAMLPAVANESVSITVKTGSIFAARFYPMLGNV